MENKNPKKCLVGIERSTGLVIINSDVPKKSMVRFLRAVAEMIENENVAHYMERDPDLVS